MGKERVEREAAMRSLRCLIGSHRWESSVVREEGGDKSIHQRCTRCRSERSRSVSFEGNAMPNGGDRTTLRPLGMDGAGADG